MPKARRGHMGGSLAIQLARRSTPFLPKTHESVVVAPGNVDIRDLPIYEVEKIIDQRKRNGRTEFLLKWKGYPEQFNSWEPRSHLMCPKLLDDYFKKPRQIARRLIYQ